MGLTLAPSPNRPCHHGAKMDLTLPPPDPHHGLGPSTPLLLDGFSLRNGGMPNPPSPSRAAGLGPGMVMGGLEGIQALPAPQCLCVPLAVTLRLPPITCLHLPWVPAESLPPV